MHPIIQKTFGVLVVLALLTGCGQNSSDAGSNGGSSGNSPSSVVKEAFTAFLKQDAETFLGYFYDLSASQKMKLREKIGKPSGKVDEINDGKDYTKMFEVQDERIFDNGEKAEVILKFHGHEKTEKISLVKTSSGWKMLFTSNM
jgi:hypothetical protein